MSGKKWSRDRVKEKVENLVLFDEKTYKRLLEEVPKMKVITPSALTERLKINGSLARKAIQELQKKGLIRKVYSRSKLGIYTRSTADAAADE